MAEPILENKPKKISKRVRRGGKKYNNHKNNKYKYINVLSTNSAGLASKEHSLKDAINYFNAKVFTVQETNYTRKEKFSMDECVAHEAIRNKKGGGSLIRVHRSLNSFNK